MTISGYHMTNFEFYDIKLCALVMALQSPQILAVVALLSWMCLYSATECGGSSELFWFWNFFENYFRMRFCLFVHFLFLAISCVQKHVF